MHKVIKIEYITGLTNPADKQKLTLEALIPSGALKIELSHEQCLDIVGFALMSPFREQVIALIADRPRIAI